MSIQDGNNNNTIKIEREFLAKLADENLSFSQSWISQYDHIFFYPFFLFWNRIVATDMSKMRFLITILFGITTAAYAQKKEDALKDYVCNILPSLEGWCSREKALNFIDLVLEVKPNLCVEIGVFGGASLFPVASALKFLGKGIIVGIDPWERSENVKYYHPIEDHVDFKWWSTLDFNYIYDSYCMMLRRNGLGDCCVSIKSTSALAAAFLDNIDILYIDGNADEGITIQDVELYLPRVLSGGYIWINNALWPQRQKAIHLLADACDFVKAVDNGSCILFKKK